ncbi:MAG: prepilin-type N-terminal cleavage/methylation protein [Rhodococcus erythropolis]|jgi:prepilin-type N-terminal cleavage/methylation domain-containing protein|nr:prepilin-type N-terminal cleavage/methylation protein [Rhodococcus erythropolis]
MRDRGVDAAGFSLVEVVIAMFLLAVIAIALLPALVDGIRYTSKQSSVATATRFMNEVVEQARQSADCTELLGFETSPLTSEDGRGNQLTANVDVSGCPGAANTARTFEITVSGAAGALASTTALVHLP